MAGPVSWAPPGGASLAAYAVRVLAAAASKRFWSVGFSGGKDSSVLLDLVLRFLSSGCPGAQRGCPERVVVVYSDTLLEPPPLRGYALGVVEAVNRLAARDGLPVAAVAARPSGEDLVGMVVGRGYPAPSPRFRWCTDRWKLRPARRALEKVLRGWSPGELAVISGIRAEEAAHRSSRGRGGGGCTCPLAVEGGLGGTAYAPLLPWTTRDIWAYTASGEPAWERPGWGVLREIYGATGGLRMGCWPCTLVAEDRGWRALAHRGLVDPGAYRLLEAWRRAWLHMSRGNPGLWRLEKKTVERGRGRGRWRHPYSKLRPEARLILGLLLEAIAQASPSAGEILQPLLPRLAETLEQLWQHRQAAQQLLQRDKELQAILETARLHHMLYEKLARPP